MSEVSFDAAALRPDDVHDRALLDRVHPPDWTNPEARGRYNLVVVGGGTAGLVAAAIAAGLGARTALVERELLGGDCLNVGCVPSKALIASARAAAAVARAGSFGVRVPAGATVDFPAVMQRLRRLRAGLAANDSAARFRDLGVDVFLGAGTFTGRDTIRVAERELRFTKACIATGARAVVPAIPGLAEAGFLTNESLFSLDELPPRLGVLGAGPIGCEMAQCFARFGSRVTVVERADRLLAREDADAAAVVRGALERDGVELATGTTLARVRAAGGAKRLVLRDAVGGERTLDVDALLVAVGRAPVVDGLALDRAGVAFDEREGVRVDDQLRTTNRRIFAAGDVCSTHRFTHAADAAAGVVVRNALFLGRARASALTIPRCTYTSPELAQVGLHPAEAAARGLELDTYRVALGEVDRAVLDGEDEGFVAVHARRGTARIVGATVVAAHAGELVSEISLAMVSGAGLKGIAGTIHPYPTQAEALRRVAVQYQRARLTPGIRKILSRLLALGR